MEVSFKAEWNKNLIRAMKCPSAWRFLPRSLSLCAIDIIRLENLIKGEQSNASFSNANKSGRMSTLLIMKIRIQPAGPLAARSRSN
jgi:hypothetical protein